jgi:hypothetical protein
MDHHSEMKKALEEVLDKTSQEPVNKKVKSSDPSNNSENVPEASKSMVKQPSDELSPLGFVVEKQSTDPLDPTDDQD